MQKELGDRYPTIREYFMKYVRKVVPKALLMVVVRGIFWYSAFCV